jgi:hypothetical protein
MESLTAFIQENLLLIGAVLLVLLIIISVVKTVIKWVIVFAVIIGFLIYGLNYDAETIKDIGQNVVEKTKEEAVELLLGDIKNAEYHLNNDGTYSITTKNIQLEGKVGSNEAKLKYLGQSITIKLDETLKNFIEQVKANGQ